MSDKTQNTPLFQWPNDESIRKTMLDILTREQDYARHANSRMDKAETEAASESISATIRHAAILRRATAKARTTAYDDTSDPMEETQRFNPLRAAPNLEKVIQQLMDKYKTPPTRWEDLVIEEEHIALRALELLPQSR